MTVVVIGKPCECCGATVSSRQSIGFADAISKFKLDTDEFPVLVRALKDVVEAKNPKIEWLLGGSAIDYNYCQIIRTPFGASNAEMATTKYGQDPLDWAKDALIEHLRSVEEVLIYGKPTVEGYRRTCGGVLHYLGRLPKPEDVVRLRPLRDLALLQNVQAPDYDGVKHEWISEISLQAYRG